MTPSIPYALRCWSLAPVAHIHSRPDCILAVPQRSSAARQHHPTGLGYSRALDNSKTVICGPAGARAKRLDFRARTNQPGETARSSILNRSALPSQCAKGHAAKGRLIEITMWWKALLSVWQFPRCAALSDRAAAGTARSELVRNRPELSRREYPWQDDIRPRGNSRAAG